MIEWDDEVYSVGIKKMDDQHKMLVGLINALEKNKWNSDKEFLDRVTNTLFDYIKIHFADEEKILKKINYPHLDAHLIGHKDFIEKIQSSVTKLENKDETDHQVLNDLLIYLNEWLVSHILNQDKDYCEWLLK
ncbi:MAG: hemerythrin family protein [Bacteriovoracaceae bacterium]|nr:hemerythrin family protein [Bacteriovoracaceae bacterium]